MYLLDNNPPLELLTYVELDRKWDVSSTSVTLAVSELKHKQLMQSDRQTNNR